MVLGEVSWDILPIFEHAVVYHCFLGFDSEMFRQFQTFDLENTAKEPTERQRESIECVKYFDMYHSCLLYQSVIFKKLIFLLYHSTTNYIGCESDIFHVCHGSY